MTESAARQALIAKDPKFETYSDIIKGACIAGYIVGYEDGHKSAVDSIPKVLLEMQTERVIKNELEPNYDPIAGIDFKTGVDGLFDAVKKITDDYNQQILKP